MKRWTVRTNELQDHLHQTVHKEPEAFERSGAGAAEKKLEILEMDPLYPSLRTKRIQGTVDLFEFSVNMDVRVIWQYDGDTIILLLDIGHHDILNQF